MNLQRTAALILIFVSALAACVPQSAVHPIEQGTSATATATAPSPATLRPSATPTIAPTRSAYSDFFTRASAESLRVLSFNVNWDSIFPDDDPQNHDLRSTNRVEAFVRILQAIEPDVICLQEINYLRATADMEAMITGILGSPEEPWQVVKVRDNLIASRFPLVREGYVMDPPPLPDNLKQAAALVDLPNDVYGSTDIYVLCSHFKASGGTTNILQRQQQADVLMAHMRDAITPGDAIDLPANTPYLLIGDYNLYDTDPANHLWTMLRGEIYNDGRFGPDFSPDWDGTALGDPRPSHIGLGEDFYSWRNDASGFNPGAYDRILYTDSVLFAENAFILNTTLLDDDVLAAYGLEFDDVLLDGQPGIFDHLPVVVDFILIPAP
jgi:endonuclease/exonuclease/phosphatase family metal-dependent hydrolase